jgi:hypothetical protein
MKAPTWPCSARIAATGRLDTQAGLWQRNPHPAKIGNPGFAVPVAETGSPMTPRTDTYNSLFLEYFYPFRPLQILP